MAILVINRSESRCSECPRSSVQWEGVTAHTESLGGWSGKPVEPCGQTYTAVSSDYAGMEASIRALRPDLPWQPTPYEADEDAAADGCICGPDCTGEAPDSRPDCVPCNQPGADIGEEPF